VEAWGEPIQLIILMEECSELIQAVSKYLRYKGTPRESEQLEANLVKEAEDVRIMLNQLEHAVIQKPRLWEKYRKAVFDAFKLRLSLWEKAEK